MRFQGIEVEEDGTLCERLYGKIQLDGLRPSNFLYSEGFRIRASQQFTRQMVSLLVAALVFFLFALLPLRRPGRQALLQRAALLSPATCWHGRTRLRRRQVPHHVHRRGIRRRKLGHQRRPRGSPDRVCCCAKTRIPEIPQLLNVLCGDMGSGGPAPSAP